MNDVIVDLKEISKIYQMGPVEIRAVDNIGLQIKKGSFCSIAGASGAGKSTLLHLIGCLDSPTSGEVKINGHNLGEMKDADLTKFRKENVGFVFQFFNLIPTLTAMENVLVPAMFDKDQKVKRAEELLEKVGMGHRMEHHPNELSGGERQRVAIARALINDPPIILADEPTGNLDSETGSEIIELFKALNTQGKTIILVTHEKDIANFANRVIIIKDGRLQDG
ncbi:MAG: ABC transporter ATP-binding protein [Thermoplasmata archaeon]|nr:ABC transporter ATP-binding protein [Thermoplasmata archaeon]